MLCYSQNLDKELILKWDKFWQDYFIPFWIGTKKIEKWNICVRKDEFLDVQQRANNALENYNGKYGMLFPKRPSLLEYVEVTERESRDQFDRLRQAQAHRSRRKVYKDAMPAADAVPKAYTDFAKKMAKKNTRKRRSAD